MHRFTIAPAALALVLALGAPATATPLPPGGTISLNGANLSTHPEWAGGVDNDNLIPWEIRNAADDIILSGTIQNRVAVSNSTGNVVIAPRLRDLVSPTGTARVVRYVTTGFAGNSLDVDFRIDGSGDVGPGFVTRSADPGDSLDFDYTTSPIAPPDSGRFLMMSCDTPAFKLEGTATIFAEESPGGAVFSTQVSGTAFPVQQQRLELLSVNRDEVGQITLVWAATPGVDYDIQRSTDGSNWFSFRSKHADSIIGFDTFFPSGPHPAELYRVVLP